MSPHTSVTDGQLADNLDELARLVNRLRRLVPRMTLSQLGRVAEAIPFPAGVEDTLLDLDTWAVVAAAALRDDVVTINLAG